MDKLKTAANAAELMALAKENGVVLESAEAQKLFDSLQVQKTGELSEEELGQVAGGIWLWLISQPNTSIQQGNGDANCETGNDE